MPERSPSNRTFQTNVASSVAPSQRRSSSPIRPAVEPLSPILGPADLATGATSSVKQTNAPGGPAKKTFTHTQAPTKYVAQPPPKPISLEENPDAIALRAAISILQIQKRKAEGDLVVLQKIQNRAREDPEGFRDALVSKKIPKKTDGLFNLSKGDLEDSDEDEDDEDDDGESENDDQAEEQRKENEERAAGGNRKNLGSNVEMKDASHDGIKVESGDSDELMLDAGQAAPRKSKGKKSEKWPPLPARQNVIRMPAINWSQYAVVGESLDKLHEDQREKPTDGVPQRLSPDGRVKPVEGGKQRSEPAVIAAPFDPFKDKIDKKKSGKR